MSSWSGWRFWKVPSRKLPHQFGRCYRVSTVQHSPSTTSFNRSISGPSSLQHHSASSPASIVAPPPWNLSILRNKGGTTSAPPAFSIAPAPAAPARHTSTTCTCMSAPTERSSLHRRVSRAALNLSLRSWLSCNSCECISPKFAIALRS